jgi:hypothetical protein
MGRKALLERSSTIAILFKTQNDEKKYYKNKLLRSTLLMFFSFCIDI